MRVFLKLSTVILALFIVCCLLTKSDARQYVPLRIINDPEVLNSTYLPDFSYAGFRNGIGQIPDFEGKVINVTDYGVIPDDGIDDSKAMLEALEVAHTTRGPVLVQLPKGKIIVTEVMKISRGDLVLRGEGSGSGGTEVHFPRPLRMVDKSKSLNELRKYLKQYDKRQRDIESNTDELFSEYSWSGGLIWVQKDGTRAAAYLESEDPKITVLANALTGQAGSRDIQIDETKNLNIGDVLELQWLNNKGESGPLLREIYGDTDLKIGSHHWTFKNRPLVRQKTQILSINENTVTISDPLLHNISDDIPAQLSRWDHIENVGIEDIFISFPNSPSFGHHLERGYNAVYFTSVYNGWIRDVSIHNSDSGILTYNSGNVTIDNIETTGQRRAHYSVHAGNVHNMLVNRLTVNQPAVHSLSLNTQSTKCVFRNAVVNYASVLDQHAGANHQNLFDDVTLKVIALRGKRGPYYPVWNGSGAPYWEPGHGRYNTTWNLKINVIGGAGRDETVELRGSAEGPDARIIGVSGNRQFKLEYNPKPYAERLNRGMEDVPSLYSYQLKKRTTP